MNLDLASPGFSLANARACLQAAADSYQSNEFNESNESEEFTNSLIQNSSTDVHVLLRRAGDTLIIAFRGSASLRNWLTNFDAHKQMVVLPCTDNVATALPESALNPQPSTINHPHLHAGFYHAALSVRDELLDAIAKTGCRNLFLTGHSLGGALAVVSAVLLDGIASSMPKSIPQSNEPLPSPPSTTNSPTIHSIYTFGQPRIGDAAFAHSALRTPHSALFRVTNRADLVPWVPGWLLGYRHFGTHIHFDALGLHQNFPLTAELALNGLELWREFRRGQCALLADHAIAQYQLALQ